MIMPRALMVASLVLSCSTACGAPSTPAESRQTTYTCCKAEDVDTPYRSGGTMSLHWIVTTPDDPVRNSPPVEPAARLTGPYPDAEIAKEVDGYAAGVPPGVATYAAAPLRSAATPDDVPVSRIDIPADAEPGLYDLHSPFRRATRP
jgi:hypothetical protein